MGKHLYIYIYKIKKKLKKKKKEEKKKKKKKKKKKVGSTPGPGIRNFYKNSMRYKYNLHIIVYTLYSLLSFDNSIGEKRKMKKKNSYN